MKQKEAKKRTYIHPEIEIIGMDSERLMAQVSGDHSSIGQGGSASDAKHWDFSEESDGQMLPTDKNPWEETGEQ